MLKFAALALALALPLAAAPALAATVTVDVDAKDYSSNTLNGRVVTGLTVRSGDVLKVSAGLRDTWTLGGKTPCTRTSNADGLAACYGNYTQGGLTARYGSLVGRIGNGSVFGAFFVIGTEFERAVADTGLLYLYAWDSFAGDNSGTIRVTVSTVPLPAGGLMLMGALAALGALRRRKTMQNHA